MTENQLTLPNGMRVVHRHDPSTAMVAVNILHDVGSRDENPQLTGMAHLFEHLMFGGSENAPDFDGEIERAGGITNAWTSPDFTNFYDILPAHNIETAFWLESDRMALPGFTQTKLDNQKSVVIEEFKQTCLNRPYGDMMHKLRGLVYKVHPYRWPTIGLTPEDIEKVTLEDVKKFFTLHYGPERTVLSVIGNVDRDSVFSLAEKWFGDIPARPGYVRNLPKEPVPDSPRMLIEKSNVPVNMLHIAFPMGGYKDEYYCGADLLTDILASGNSSRFYRNLLLGTDLFSSVDACILGSEDPGFLHVIAAMADNNPETLTNGENCIKDELQKLLTDGVTQKEVTRAINRFVSDKTFEEINYGTAAQNLALATLHNEKPGENLETYRSLTADDVSEAAKSIIDFSRSSTLIYEAQ
ncbi:MAG: insulinase family protein [Muribaculaceae bacterium]|nr:insulinase family protein [Muribaculaceae bacterium]MDE7155834.1 insulinase family protein [Muribaculaceae bacterium]MDE7368820.1 insulinase family protein [Muribaculaceae bacterium]